MHVMLESSVGVTDLHLQLIGSSINLNGKSNLWWFVTNCFLLIFKGCRRLEQPSTFYGLMCGHEFLEFLLCYCQVHYFFFPLFDKKHTSLKIEQSTALRTRCPLSLLATSSSLHLKIASNNNTVKFKRAKPQKHLD